VVLVEPELAMISLTLFIRVEGVEGWEKPSTFHEKLNTKSIMQWEKDVLKGFIGFAFAILRSHAANPNAHRSELPRVCDIPGAVEISSPGRSRCRMVRR